MTLLPRLILLVALLFWQGGFMFYGSVVVTVGAQVLGSELEQGFITQSVTNYLNLAGALCLAIWSAVMWRDKIQWLGWMLWSILALSLATLAILHIQMDRKLEIDTHTVTANGFYQLHRAYLATSTAQWLISITLLGLTLRQWRRADQKDVLCDREQ